MLCRLGPKKDESSIRTVGSTEQEFQGERQEIGQKGEKKIKCKIIVVTDAGWSGQ